jgi:hypothetical protein
MVQDLRLDGLGPHVYQPLMSSAVAALGLTPSRRGELNVVRVRPDALNAGERKFVVDLAEYLSSDPDPARAYELYLLRNVYRLSRMGLYLDSDEHVFFPDFVLWAVERGPAAGTTNLVFVDPKGQMGMIDPTTLESNAKVRLGDPGNAALKDLSRRLSETHGTVVRVHSFLLLRDSSVLGSEQSRRRDEAWLQANLVDRNVLRLDWHRLRENGDLSDFHTLFGGRSYLDLMFDRLIRTA